MRSVHLCVTNASKQSLTEPHRTNLPISSTACKYAGLLHLRESGGGLKIRRPERAVGVQVPLPAPRAGSFAPLRISASRLGRRENGSTCAARSLSYMTYATELCRVLCICHRSKIVEDKMKHWMMKRWMTKDWRSWILRGVFSMAKIGDHGFCAVSFPWRCS